MKKLLMLASTLFVLVSCSKSVEIKSVDYYLQHADEMNAMLKKCQNLSLDEYAKDANCSNADKASTKKALDSMSHINPGL